LDEGVGSWWIVAFFKTDAEATTRAEIAQHITVLVAHILYEV